MNSTIVFADTTGPQGSAAAANTPASGKGVSSAASIKPSQTSQEAVKITGVPDGAQDIAFSYDDKYCTYIDQSELYVKEIETGQTVKKITGSGISSPVLMNDRNVLMYFTENASSITLNTYNIDSDQTNKQTSISVSNASKIKVVDYSNSTNLIYVNVENSNGPDRVYAINIMKNTQRINVGSVVDNMVLLGKANSLYYNDQKNNLYLHGKPFAGGMQKGKLLGRDAEDNVYVQSMDDASSISVIANENVIKTLTLPDTNYSRFYADKKSVFAVFSGYIINLSKGADSRMQFDKNLQFLGMGGSNVYFRDLSNNIVGIKSTI